MPTDPDRSVQYTASANLLEKTKAVTLPSKYSMTATDPLDTFEWERNTIEEAGSIVGNNQLALTFSKSKSLSVENPAEIYFLAIAPIDPAVVKTQPMALAIGDVTGLKDFQVPLSDTTNTPPALVKPEDVAKSIVEKIRDIASGQLFFVMPEGGFIFAGPSARLLANALVVKNALTVWNLSASHSTVDITVGRRFTAPGAPVPVKVVPADKQGDKPADKPGESVGGGGAVHPKRS